MCNRKSVFWICHGHDTHDFPAAMIFCMITAQNQIHQCLFRMRERLTGPLPAQSDYLQFMLVVVGGYFLQSFSFIYIVLAPMNDLPPRLRQIVLIYTWWLHTEEGESVEAKCGSGRGG